MFLPFEPTIADYLDKHTEQPIPQPHGIVHVESCVPFSPIVHFRLRYHNINLATLQRYARYNFAYLAWESVRLGGNPFLQTGTGFEGYFVGQSESPDEVLHHILDVCHRILDAIARCYRMEYGFRNKLIKTLMGDIYEPRAVEIWSSQLGAALARLRCNLTHNKAGTDFRLNTYLHVKEHPVIEYHDKGASIHQTYKVCTQCGKNYPIYVTSENLNLCDQEAWLVATSIGRFGHPLVRHALDLSPWKTYEPVDE